MRAVLSVVFRLTAWTSVDRIIKGHMVHLKYSAATWRLRLQSITTAPPHLCSFTLTHSLSHTAAHFQEINRTGFRSAGAIGFALPLFKFVLSWIPSRLFRYEVRKWRLCSSLVKRHKSDDLHRIRNSFRVYFTTCSTSGGFVKGRLCPSR